MLKITILSLEEDRPIWLIILLTILCFTLLSKEIIKVDIIIAITIPKKKTFLRLKQVINIKKTDKIIKAKEVRSPLIRQIKKLAIRIK